MGQPDEGLLLLDKSLYVKAGNDFAVRLLQRPISSLIGKHIRELLPSECTPESITGALVANVVKFAFGSLVVLFQPVSLSEIGGIIILRNIPRGSEIDYSIEKCKNIVNELANPINTDPVEIFIADDEGITLEVIMSDSEQLYGLAASNFIGKNVRELEQNGYFFPSLTRLVLESKKQVAAVRETKTGRKLLASAQPVYDSSGNMRQIITVSREINGFYALKKLLSKIEETMLGDFIKDVYITQEAEDLAGYIVKSPVMKKVLQQIRRVAFFDSTVLLLGETGTGKGSSANLLHRLSPRKAGAFVHVNCGAIPEHLMESEFFGYVPGSFTGANKEGKKGLVELAQKGILFLDEVDCLSLSLQAKLLHLIQEREFMPVGGTKKVSVDVRFVAATNKDLTKMIEEGHFREDLYYRLNVVPIVIPPLRERKEEILAMALYFLERLCKRYGVQRQFSASFVKILLNYNWPGNVRELENMIERCVVTSSGPRIPPELLEGYLQETKAKTRLLQTSAIASTNTSILNNKVEKMEKAILKDALHKYGSTRKAAAHLGINQSTVVRKMKKYGLALTPDT